MWRSNGVMWYQILFVNFSGYRPLACVHIFMISTVRAHNWLCPFYASKWWRTTIRSPMLTCPLAIALALLHFNRLFTRSVRIEYGVICIECLCVTFNVQIVIRNYLRFIQMEWILISECKYEMPTLGSTMGSTWSHLPLARNNGINILWYIHIHPLIYRCHPERIFSRLFMPCIIESSNTLVCVRPLHEGNGWTKKKKMI